MFFIVYSLQHIYSFFANDYITTLAEYQSLLQQYHERLECSVRIHLRYFLSHFILRIPTPFCLEQKKLHIFVYHSRQRRVGEGEGQRGR